MLDLKFYFTYTAKHERKYCIQFGEVQSQGVVFVFYISTYIDINFKCGKCPLKFEEYLDIS